MNAKFWDERYKQSIYAYGQTANVFVQEQLAALPIGKALFACEGEGRNAVYAASKGHTVYAFDMSVEGKNKALNLAQLHHVNIEFEVANAASIEYPESSFDAVFLIYAHLPSPIRQHLHRRITQWLKPNGIVILEAFQKAQLGNASGGPKDPDMLYSKALLEHDFSELHIIENAYHQVELNEGSYHIGKANIIRMIAKKMAL